MPWETRAARGTAPGTAGGRAVREPQSPGVPVPWPGTRGAFPTLPVPCGIRVPSHIPRDHPRYIPLGLLLPIDSPRNPCPHSIPRIRLPTARSLGSFSRSHAPWASPAPCTLPGIPLPVPYPLGAFSPLHAPHPWDPCPLAQPLGSHCYPTPAISPVFSCLRQWWHPRPWQGGAEMICVPARLEQSHAEL